MVRYKDELVTFGETMIRLSPSDHQRLEQAERLDVHVGGSELNVAVAAQRLGLQTTYVTRLSKNSLGRKLFVVLTAVQRQPQRIENCTCKFMKRSLTG